MVQESIELTIRSDPIRSDPYRTCFFYENFGVLGRPGGLFEAHAPSGLGAGPSGETFHVAPGPLEGAGP